MSCKHDMTTIVKPMNEAVDAEYNRAASIHGKTFASVHEGYGVISEELQEAVTEVERAQAVMYHLLKAIHREDQQTVCDYADRIRDTVVNGAAELVQVAAMCRKMAATLQDGENP